MDSNQLLHYLRGFFELVDEPTPAQIRAIRNEGGPLESTVMKREDLK